MLKTPCQHSSNIGSISCVCIVNTPSPVSLLRDCPVWGVVVCRTRQNCIAYPATRMRWHNTDTMLGQCRRWGNRRWWAKINSGCVSGDTLVYTSRTLIYILVYCLHEHVYLGAHAMHSYWLLLIHSKQYHALLTLDTAPSHVKMCRWLTSYVPRSQFQVL